MKQKTVITWVLLLFVAASVVFLAVRLAREKVSSAAIKAGTGYRSLDSLPAAYDLAETTGGDADIVCYFMTTQRCTNCYKIEIYTKETVERDFADKLADKTLLWQVINLEERQNRHFVKDYGLFTKSVVLVKIRGGKQVAWKNLDRVWSLLDDEDTFRKYIAAELGAFLEKS